RLTLSLDQLFQAGQSTLWQVKSGRTQSTCVSGVIPFSHGVGKYRAYFPKPKIDRRNFSTSEMKNANPKVGVSNLGGGL
ncbi:hypothetical protein, partial [Herbaspirillum aquaticum]|uniref:hypothetical protein n=1 Tax=Herbaspirillum aquaticum TaxID=568783 RepID=UPI0024DE5A9E